VGDDGVGHVPALPAGLRGAVAEVDVLAVEAEAGVEAAELVQQLPSQEQERAEHPVRLHRLRRELVELVVLDLARLRAQDLPERRPAHDGASDRREPAARRLACSIRILQLRPEDPGARMGLGEFPEHGHGVRPGLGVGVGDDDQGRARGGDAPVRVRCESERLRVDDQLRVDGGGGRVRDDDELVHLWRERGEATLEIRIGPVRDHDARDAHRSSR
jgi:hypothetical protein